MKAIISTEGMSTTIRLPANRRQMAGALTSVGLKHSLPYELPANVLLCMISLPVFALEEVPGSRDHDVVATYNRGDRNVYLGIADEKCRYIFTIQVDCL